MATCSPKCIQAVHMFSLCLHFFFLPTNMHIRMIGDSKLTIGMSIHVLWGFFLFVYLFCEREAQQTPRS